MTTVTYRPSKAPSFTRCPASAKYSSDPSEAALRGTQLHAEAAQALDSEDFDYSAYTKWVERQRAFYDGMFIEHPINCGASSGTADLVLYDTAWRIPPMIVDLKTGMIPVEVHDNRQLAMYAYGFLSEYNQLSLGAYGVIFQFGAATSTFFSNEYLECVINAVQWARNNPEVHVAGNIQCRYCSHKTECGAFMSHYFEGLDKLSLAEKFARIENIRKWCDEIEDAAYTAHSSGNLPGYKLVPGRMGQRKWKDGAVEELEAAGVEMYKQVLKSPADFKDSTNLRDFVVQFPTKAKLKPE